MKVSVVIPVYNGGQSFRSCLASVFQCRPPADEVIVVSDASTDGSEDTAKSLGAAVILLPSNSGPSKARNIGVRAASGDLILFVDADISVPVDLVGRVKAAFHTEDSTAALFGSYDAFPVQPQFISQYRNLLHHHIHQTGNEEASTFWTGCGAIRREIFLKVDGFNEERRYLEDVELGYRLTNEGYRILLLKSLQVKHHKRWTLRSTLITDVLHRAVPWTELIWDYEILPNDLNLKTSSRGSVLALLGLLTAAAIAISSPVARGLSLVATGIFLFLLLSLNYDIYRFFWRSRGPLFAVGVLPLHWLYFLYAGATYAACNAWFFITGRRRGRLNRRNKSGTTVP